jgi:hypothetical protein
MFYETFADKSNETYLLICIGELGVGSGVAAPSGKMLIISVRGNYCDYLPREPQNLAVTLVSLHTCFMDLLKSHVYMN